ncbi:hypothetical protein ACQ4PT_058924 [Festuca glaucescens]
MANPSHGVWLGRRGGSRVADLLLPPSVSVWRRRGQAYRGDGPVEENDADDEEARLHLLQPRGLIMIVVCDILAFDISRSLEKQPWESWRKRSLEKELWEGWWKTKDLRLNLILFRGSLPVIVEFAQTMSLGVRYEYDHSSVHAPGTAIIASRLEPSSLQVAFFYASLYLIAIAQGADKPCGLAFAADQFDPDHTNDQGTLVPQLPLQLVVLLYVRRHLLIYVAVVVVSYVQENVGWGIAFGSLCAIMLCTFTVFLVGTPTYHLYTPTPNAETAFARLARSLATLASSSGFIKRHHQREEEDEDAAAKSEKAREVLRLVPIWAACLAYGMVYAQLMTLFNKQGRTMDRRVFGGLDLELPPAALQTIGEASVLTFVPIYDHVLVPALRYATGNP